MKTARREKMKRKKEGNRKGVKKQKGSQSGDFVDQEEMKTLLSGKKISFSDDEGDDDIDIDIRDEEDETSGNIGEDEVKKFIKKLGLDQFDGHQPVMDEDDKSESDLENQKGKISSKLDKKSSNKTKKEEKPTKTENRNKESVHVRFDAEDNPSEPSVGKRKKKKNQRKSASDVPVQYDEVSSSSQASSQLLIQLEGKWFEEMPSSRVIPTELPDETVVSTYQVRAKELYEKEVGIYEKERVKEDESHSQWMKTVVLSGVMADKIAALGLQIQQAPVHTLQYLDQLLSLAKKKGRREAGVAVDALRHLFLEELLPNDRKLRRFEKHGFDQLDSLSKKEREKQLILWYFESQLKTKYETYVTLQQTLSYDTVEAVKAKSISTMYELLVNKPELEQKLLSQLVNKLGDPDYKVASKVVHWLKNLVKVHAQMKEVVVTEVEQLLYRPNISSKTQYYCICFLNQLLLSSRESNLAAKLITIYFKFFNLCMKKKKDTSDKILNALLTGVNRAYPYSKVDDAKVNEQMDLLFKVIHQSTFNTGLQAMMLLKQVLAARHTMNDRFYSALYRKLLDPGLANSTHQAMFLNLIYQATKDDIDIKRIMAFIKRTLQVCHGQLPPFICGALFMVSEVIKKHPSMLSIKQLQDESDDEEHFEDVKEEDDDTNATAKDDTSEDKKDEEKSKASGWIHKPVIKQGQSKGYDALARNPSFSGAERSILWELKKLANHYHPSVSQFATTILSGESISYGGNPLDDFTLMRFLDRFVYKNPKTKTENSGKISAPFEKKTLPSSGVSNVKSNEFLTLPKEDVPLDVKFFHQYFSQKAEIETRRKEQEEENKRKHKAERGEDDTSSLSDEDSEASSVGDEEFEEILEEEMDKLMEESDIDSLSEDDETDDDESGEELAEDLDFARDLSSKKKTKSEDSENSEDDGSDFDEDWDEEDDDDDEDADAFEVKNDDEFDEEGFGESDDDDGPPEPKVQKKTKIKTKAKVVVEKKKGKQQQKKKKQPDEDAELQENAEKFSSMIDENVSSKFDTMTMEALSNRDKAKWKQLEWEVNRDKWIRGRDTKTIVQAKKTKKRHRWFSKKKKPGKFGGKKK